MNTRTECPNPVLPSPVGASMMENPADTQIRQRLDWEPDARLAALSMVAADGYRRCMRYFASGVNIITARDGEARAGLTATAVCSVTADPPRMVVFVNKNVVASDIVMRSGALCVNLLAADQEEVARVFAGMNKDVRGEARFLYGKWGDATTGAPVLEGALASFDCRVIKVFEESTHRAFVCEVLATAERNDAESLIYLNGGFRSLPL